MSLPLMGPRAAVGRGLRLVREDQPEMAVLVVDDEPGIRAALLDLLEDEGYATLQAADGSEALDIVREVRMPLVVLLDWMMPNLDGITLLQMVAADPVLSSQHAFIFTSAAFPAGLREVAALPQRLRVDILVRPCNIELLLTKVEEAAERLKRAHEDAGSA